MALVLLQMVSGVAHSGENREQLYGTWGLHFFNQIVYHERSLLDLSGVF